MRRRVAVKVAGQLNDAVVVENGHGTVFIQAVAEGQDAIAMLAPEAADALAQLLIQKAEESRTWRT